MKKPKNSFNVLASIKFDISGLLNAKNPKDMEPLITQKGMHTTCEYVPKDKKKWN